MGDSIPTTTINIVTSPEPTLEVQLRSLVGSQITPQAMAAFDALRRRAVSTGQIDDPVVRELIDGIGLQVAMERHRADYYGGSGLPSVPTRSPRVPFVHVPNPSPDILDVLRRVTAVAREYYEFERGSIDSGNGGDESKAVRDAYDLIAKLEAERR